MRPKFRQGVVKELITRHVFFRKDQYLVTIECSDPNKPGKNRYIKYIIPRESYTSLSLGMAVGIPTHWVFEQDVTSEWKLNEWVHNHIVSITAIGLGVFAVIFGVLIAYSNFLWR